MGLTSDEPIPAYSVVDIEIDAPPLDEGGMVTSIKGAIRPTYTVVQGTETLCGGIWQTPPAGVGLVALWIERLGR